MCEDARVTDNAQDGGADGPRQYPTRTAIMLSGLRSTAFVSLQVVACALGLWVLFWVLGKTWVVLLPVLFAIVLCTVLWPPVRWLRDHRVPPAAAAVVMMLVGLGVIAGILAVIVPSIIDQVPDLASKATDGINKVYDWLQGPPLNIEDEQVDKVVDTIIGKVQSSATTIAAGVFSGVGTATSIIVTLFTTLVLVFFFLKDGPKFVPWLDRTVGRPAGYHLGEVLLRMWNTLGGFIRTQALVSFIDAFFIGIGLLILDVPLAWVLMVITFLGGFIPIVGAFVAGALAVLIALVTNGLTTALIVLAIIIAVQQLEGNVLQPWLQAKSMDLHAVIVLLAVTLGSTMFGITGAFLAVPAAACIAVVFRYLNEQIAERAGETLPPVGAPITEEVGEDYELSPDEDDADVPAGSGGPADKPEPEEDGGKPDAPGPID
ncbi:AI-2E family transporter [Gordonia amarae]|uniref:AI-2E family transporter n=1 Tax=Gordonia amarae TaxID=36821 RepID=A0A857MGC8_9ACTN|nr:AI-2E family transporter [Gordonia amarae]QHN18434.1 AI-2E family transporter [Gordonia amarae]QHN22916.1 AI-2E family transporter [Gordonia amarae]QHN31819.1 AI-2E family transporter [Gordonia amarae]QHN40565.1 AI-2E family transporter [Gordonia amarae]